MSVVIPAYNAGRYLAEAIESVLAQTRPVHEIIVVDDGSTDNTAEVAARFGAQIRYLRQPNGGTAAARNSGLEIASSDYVLFLDADDLLLPESLALLASYLDTHPEMGAVYSDGFYCNDALARLWTFSSQRTRNATGCVLEDLVVANNIRAIHSAIVRLRTIREHALHFDSSVVIIEDADFWIRLAAVEQFGYVDAVTCLYRIHGGNITITLPTDRRRDAILRFRLKTMNGWFFDGLSEATRASFFYYLLMEEARFRPAARREIVQGSQFGALSPQVRRRLLRQTAVQALVDGEEAVARELLALARSDGGLDIRRVVVQALARLPHGVACSAFNAWRGMRRRLKGGGALQTDVVTAAFRVR